MRYAPIALAIVFVWRPAFALEASPNSTPKIANKVLWAWRRPENLTSIDKREFAVAYLACHAFVVGAKVNVQWRDQPLRIPAGTVVIPTVRIDVLRNKKPVLAEDQLNTLAHVISRAAKVPQAGMVQIDFDALQSERPFYRQLIKRIRNDLPPDMPISITALASWCLFDNWMKDLPVEETVPMMFSLGKDREKILRYFRAGKDFLDERSRRTLGLSLDDTEINDVMIPLARARKMPVRIYIFTRTAWTGKKIQQLRSLPHYL
ncbi:MAG TPA: hypothetical protein V6D17_16325 [Candidatus Obscuribacterales bacterium]